jgi:hypothetical protein
MMISVEISTEIIISLDSFLSLTKSIFGAPSKPFLQSQNVVLFLTRISTPSRRAASLLSWEKGLMQAHTSFKPACAS